jgi:hypothetical protein
MPASPSAVTRAPGPSKVMARRYRRLPSSRPIPRWMRRLRRPRVPSSKPISTIFSRNIKTRPSISGKSIRGFHFSRVPSNSVAFKQSARIHSASRNQRDSQPPSPGCRMLWAGIGTAPTTSACWRPPRPAVPLVRFCRRVLAMMPISTSFAPAFTGLFLASTRSCWRQRRCCAVNGRPELRRLLPDQRG